MPMIGASTADLANSSALYRTVSGVIRDSGTTVLSTVNNSVSNLQTETNNAQTTCLDAIEGMKTDFGRVHSVLLGAEYVGKNADVAREASNEMDQRCAQAVADMTAAFDQFRVQISTLGDDLTEIAQTYDNYSAAASESSDSMAQALVTQRENLQAAMEGMTY